ncbi:MAG TPA: isochorismatase family protein [Phycisphaerales bacterium]|nr:isochorismatase family protein [Phycisphaerales bacterium]
MIMQLLKHRRKHVLIDIDTQRDFLLPGGNACIKNHADVLANIRRMMAWARYKSIPIISTAEVHPDNNGSSIVRYCIDGTRGQRKIRYTLLGNRVSFPADTLNPLPADLMVAYRQVILHKRTVDPFEEPRIERLLSEVLADEFVLIGAGTEDAVEATALGLLRRGRNVRIVADALGAHDKKEGKLAVRKMKAKGAKLTKTRDLAGVSHLRCTGVCGCERCRGRTRIEQLQISTGHLRPAMG